MITLDPTTWSAARRALEKALALYLDDPNVSHLDLGFRTRSSAGHCIEPELTVRVHVHQKLYGDAFRAFAAREPHRVIDAERIGFAVDVPHATYCLDLWQEASVQLNQRVTLHGGVGIFNVKNRNIGTLGGKVRDRQSGEDLILSSWHVLAGSWTAKQAIAIHQEMRTESNETEAIAEYIRGAMHAGLDAAVARLNGQRLLPNEQLGIGAVTGVVIPQLGMHVIKSGQGTQVTSGIITGVLGYSIHRYAGIKCLIGPIVLIAPEEPGQKLCAPGDSGAWWLEQDSLRAVALHFAGSRDPAWAGLALSMPEVLEALDVDIVTEQPLPSSIVHVCNLPIDVQQRTTTAPALTPQAEDIIAVTEVEIISEQDSPQLQKKTGGIAHRLVHVGLLLGVAMVALGYHLLNLTRQQQEKINRLQRQVQHLVANAQVDSTRRSNVRKVVAIIDRFNPDMKSESKFRIAGGIYEMSLKYRHLDVELICATITHETARTWNPETVSPAGAMGLMQLLPATALYLAREEGITWSSAEDILFDPIYSIRLGCRYLSALVAAYSVDGGLAAYNGGERRAELWLRGGRVNGILHEETAFYVPSVLKIYEEYRRMNM